MNNTANDTTLAGPAQMKGITEVLGWLTACVIYKYHFSISQFFLDSLHDVSYFHYTEAIIMLVNCQGNFWVTLPYIFIASNINGVFRPPCFFKHEVYMWLMALRE